MAQQGWRATGVDFSPVAIAKAQASAARDDIRPEFFVGRIGATKCADIVERALQVVSPEPLPDDDDARSSLVDNLDEEADARLEALDSEFCSYPDDLTALLFDYVRAHPQEFGSVPS